MASFATIPAIILSPHLYKPYNKILSSFPQLEEEDGASPEKILPSNTAITMPLSTAVAVPPNFTFTMSAPPDITIPIPSSREPAVTVLSKIDSSKPPPQPECFVVNILALLEVIAGITPSESKVLLTETAVSSPANPEVVATSPTAALPESVIDIPNWEISASTSAVPEVDVATPAPPEVAGALPPPVKITGLVNGREKSMQILQIVMRNLAAMATLAASIIMLFNEQQIHLFGLQLTETYKFSPAFKFFVIGNGVACFYAFLSMIIIIYYGSNLAMHFFDTLMMGLIIAAAAAATTVSYIGKKGNTNALWQPVCSHAEDFCYHSTVSIGCSYLGFLLLFLVFTLTFISKLSR